MTTTLDRPGRLQPQPTIERRDEPTAAQWDDQLGDAEPLLTPEQLAAISSTPATECERCRAPFDGDRYLLEITGHYVSGSSWELCVTCTSEVMHWLGGRLARLHANGETLPAPRSKHQ